MSTGDRDHQRGSSSAGSSSSEAFASSPLATPAPGKVTRMPQSMAEPPAVFGQSRASLNRTSGQRSDRAEPWVMDDASMSAMGLSHEPEVDDEKCRLPSAPSAGGARAARSGADAGRGADASGPEAMWSHIIGERSTSVGKLARVRAPKGVHLRTRAAADQPSLGILPFDELVTVERRTEHGWYWVIPTGSLSATPGFCEEQFLSVDPPEPTAHLHRVSPGDSLRVIAERYYGKQFREGRDARLYVQALYEANKNHKGVYLTEVDLSLREQAGHWEDDEKTLEIYRGVKVREGHALWLPSEAFIEQLRAAGTISSGTSISAQAWRGAKAAVGQAVDAATYGAAFTVGLLEGAWGAIVDLFQGAADMIELVARTAYQLVTGNPGAIKDMLMEWVAKLKVAWGNRAQLAADFMSKWESDDAWTRGNFQGEILGWVMMTALLILATSGASALAAATGRGAIVLRLLSTIDALGDVTTYLAKLGRLPGKVIAHLRRRFSKGPSDVAGDATQDAVKVTDEVAKEAGEKGTDAAGGLTDSPSPAATKGLSAKEWEEQLKLNLLPDELAQYERMKGKWKTPEEMQQAFGGNLDAARADIAREVGKKAEAAALKKRSLQRADEIRAFVEEHGLMKHEKVREILEGLPVHPSKAMIGEAAATIRSLIISEIRIAEVSARFPGATVLSEVKVWELQPHISAQNFYNMPGDVKSGLTLRDGKDGQKSVYKIVTDIDLLVHRTGDDGKYNFLRLEQQKTGLSDTHGGARGQNNVALSKLLAARSGRTTIRLEMVDEVDLIDQFNLASADRAAQVTVGPAGKGFDESLGITAADLERLMKNLVQETLTEGSP